MKKMIRDKGIKGLLFASILSFLFSLLILLNVFVRMNNRLMDLMYQKPKQTNDIFIVGIDDKSLEELGPYNTWNRSYYAKVIENLSTKNPAVIGLDVLFTGESSAEDDNALVTAITNSNSKVVCGCNLLFGDNFDDNTFTVSSEIKGVSYAYNALKEKTSCGYVNALLDKEDSVARKVMPVMSSNNNVYDSFSYAIYKEYQNYFGYDLKAYEANKIYRINYSGNPGTSYTILSFADIYNGNVPSDIEGSIILVGAYSSGLQDNYFTAIKNGALMNGVEIHANIIDCYLKDNLITDIPNIIIVIIALVSLFIFAYLIYKGKLWISSLETILYIGLLFLIQTIMFGIKLYMPLTSIILAAVIIYVIYIAFKYGEELITRYKTVNVFKKYVAPQVVDKALKEANYQVNVGGEKRHVACLFVDIRGFTPLSEGLEPEQVVAILNEYLTLTTNSIFAVGGTLDKFIGDATMAIFNAPFDLDDYLFKAVKAGWLIKKGSEEIDEMAVNKYGKHVSFGIGINSGYAVCGNIGSKERMDYTAIGDTINTASRLEANAKAGEILISEALYNEVKDRIEAEYIGELSLKGKSQGVKTYRVTNIKDGE